MPKKDGFEVLKELGYRMNSKIPFIMVTAVNAYEKTKEAYSCKADFYIAKPIKIPTLLRNVKTLLALSNSKAY